MGGTTVELHTDDYFYGFYSQINDTENQQFIIYNNGRQIDDDTPISLDRLEYPPYYGPHPTGTPIPIPVKANRLVDTYDSNIDRTIDKYYTTYTKDGHDYRIYSEVEYKRPYSLTNYIDVSGFMGYKTTINDVVYPAVGIDTDYYPALTIENLTNPNRQKYYK